jgi:hypothetical protein
MSRIFWLVSVTVVIIGVLVGVVLFFNKGDFGGCSEFVDVSSKQSVSCGVVRSKELTIGDTLRF